MNSVFYRRRPRAFQDNSLSAVVDTLREKLEKASASISALEEEKTWLQGQVDAREQEIERLGKQINADSNLEKVHD